MTRLRRRLVLTCGSACCLLLTVLVAARGQQFAGADPERAFSFGDADLDGKLSPDEFRDLLRNAPRFKNAAAAKKAPARIEPIFRRLDADHDGFLTPAEYRAINPFRPGGTGAMAKANAKPAPRADDRPITAEQAKFFETKIRPVLATKCAQCHASDAETLKGGLLVDSREGLRRGGDTGPAVVPGDLDASLLIAAIRFQDESLKMPPKAKLSDEVVADFEAWVKMGAPDPRGGGSAVSRPAIDVEKGRQFWAFQPPKAVPPPKVKGAAWPKSDLDRFLLAALEARGMTPVADAGRPALIRRASFDLTGLPPTPEEVEAFVNDASADAFAKVVDRLLASPRFGERWGRHWLDVARYAESSGKANMTYPNAWRYRDWVIDALNKDTPYNEFVARQVAGDLLPAQGDRARAEGAVATGFLAVGSKTHNTRDRQQFLIDLADEQIDTTSRAFLGLTIACARCHDHKFDPISQKDYYALSGIFQSTQTCYGTLPGVIQNVNPSPLVELPAAAKMPSATPELTPRIRSTLEARLAELIKTRDGLTPEQNFTGKGIQTRTQLAVLRFRLASYRPDGTPRTYAMGARDRPDPVDSPLYVRGELEHPAESVPRGLIPVLSRETPPAIRQGSGRVELARWLASAENPLTARVMVNRVWLHLFGRGLVVTPDNFGVASAPPSHPELLDSLAVAFINDNWSVKTLIRRIVLSHAYQLGSSHDAANFAIDPDNTLVWRMSPRRLEAEALRDAVLAVSGRLNLEPPIGSAVAETGEGRAGPFRGFDKDVAERHRAVYLPVVRDQLPESLTLFDFADPSLGTGERSTTSGPTQALYLMNSPFVIREAEAAAGRLLAIDGDYARVEAAYRRFLSRPPTDRERDRAREFLTTFDAKSSPEDRARAALTAFCQALYASAEFRYLD